jgi:hypothetical protein
MLAPSMLEARNLHREAQALIEQAPVQEDESSASRIRQQGSARDDGGAQGPEASVHAGGAAERPSNQGARRSGSGSLTHVGKPKMVTLATSSMRGGQATPRHGRQQATTPDGAGAMSTERIARRRRNPREPVYSAGRSAL